MVTGVSLSDYHGVDSMTSFTPKGLAKGLVYTYGYFLSYFFTTSYTFTIDRIICNVIGAVAFLGILVRRLQVKRIGETEGTKETDGKKQISVPIFCFYCFLFFFHWESMRRPF